MLAGLLAATTRHAPRRFLNKVRVNFTRDNFSKMNEMYKETARRMKPPNILVNTDDSCRFDAWKAYLDHILCKDQCTIYQLPSSKVSTVPWSENCSLLILESHVNDINQRKHVEQYLDMGGKVLWTLCPQSRNTEGSCIKDEIRYKSNPEFGLFGAWLPNIDNSDEQIGALLWSNAVNAREPITTDAIVIAEAVSSGKKVVWATKKGQLVFSYVDIPSLFQDSVAEMRHHSCLLGEAILLFLQMAYRGVAHTSGTPPSLGSMLTPAFFMGMKQDQAIFLQSFKNALSGKVLRGQSLNLAFVDKEESQEVKASSEFLPIVMNSGCSTFNYQEFHDHLKTSWLGRFLIFAETVESTQDIFDRNNLFNVNSPNGLVFTARQQTKGQGRGGNVWLSPMGCMMFSAKITVPVQSPLGQKLPFLQHIAAVAVARGVRGQNGYEDVPINLKWPNDIYYNSSAKIGGILVKSSYCKDDFHAIVGMGVNVSNERPTLCIHRVIEEFNAQRESSLAEISIEALLGRTLTEFEKLIALFQKDGAESFCREYYRYWIHGGQKVHLGTENSEDVTVCGLDDFGYLQVERANGTKLSLQPDGNTFDMTRNLIRLK